MATAPISIPAAARAPARPPCAPATPGSWNWRCHRCRRHWPLTITKCLTDDCGHVRCSLREGQPEHRRYCKVRFDIEGWRAHFNWRHRQEPGVGTEEDALAKMRDGTYRCEVDCAYPSQCYADRMEERLAARLSRLALDSSSHSSADDASADGPSSRPSSPAGGKQKSSSTTAAVRRVREHVNRPSPLNPAWTPEDIFL
ncbi:hypothetical protein HDV57DRAFT_518604 [Trichoderma longibrachiatum]|uniref:Uncharacterized protein n=1 Tax=Trichoderma longibrachiatum ATCC 18648 TaxID=983965 RepID=A0A2T4BS01_TRILO|nr:hypothetical protein M440DRAFT_1465820 [Trichoderma longibrachiatum ATCC 18648]